MNLLIIALTPVLIVVLYIYAKDKFEKEAKHILFYNFLLGAIVSVLISTLLYVVSDIFVPLNNHFSIAEQFIKAFLIVGVIEEFSKYIVVRYYAQPKSYFNEPFDGIIYAVMVSMGFAAVENVFYILEGGLQTAILRAFTAIPAHATFAIIMGFFMGKAKFTNQRSKWNLIGLLLAIVFHGAYDFFLFLDFIPGISIGAFASLIIGLILSKKAIKIHQENSNFKT